MKIIDQITIWSDGQTKYAKILNAIATTVNLDQNATFTYFLYELRDDGYIGSLLSTGNVFMDDQEYQLWDNDIIAWDFIANQLNLTITGDYNYPIIPENA